MNVSDVENRAAIRDNAQKTAQRDVHEATGETLTKADLTEGLCERVGLNMREAREMVDAFFDVIRETLEDGDNVLLSGFGKFQLRDKRPRPGRNPQTGELALIAARRVVTFLASGGLKNRIVAGAGTRDGS